MLLLDEPSSGLDPSQRVRLWEFVAGLAKGGTTVIYSTHQIEEASHYGDRLVVLADGETIFDGSFAQLRRAAGPPPEGDGGRPGERLRPLPAAEGPLMRWLLVKDLQLLRRSPLVTGLLVVYPIVLAVLIGLAISRSPEKPRVAFLNQIPAGTGLQLGTGGFSQDEARRQLCAKIECVDVSSRAEARAEGEGRRRPRRADPAGGLHQQAAGRAQHQLERAGDGRRDRQQRRPAQGAGGRRPDPLAAHPGQPAALARRSATSPGTTSRSSPNGGSFEIPFINQTVHILGLRKAEEILNQVETSLPPAKRAQVAQVSNFARLARQNLALANSLLASVRQPIAVNKDVIAGSVPPLDTFAVAVAAAITLLFVTVLLVSGSLALEREENTFTRLTRGLVSRTGLLVEKATLGHRRGPGGDPADAARRSRRSNRSPGAGST